MADPVPDLTYEELRQVAVACMWVMIAPQTPSYFQQFLVRRLEPAAPDLARRIAGYDAAQVEVLCEWLRGRQELLSRV
jgi:hypothetical protein